MPTKLKTVYDTVEEIPQGFEELYTERNGHWEFTGVEGVKTQADIDRISQALVKERTDHKATKDKLAPFVDLDPEEVRTKLEGYDSLNEQVEALKAGGAFDETKAEPIIQARVRQAIGPLERDKLALTRQVDDAKKKLGLTEQEIASLKQNIVADRIERTVRDAAIGEKVLGTAVSDAVLHARGIFEETEDGRIITKDGAGATPGLSPKDWLNEMKERAPHWWPQSQGGGARGGVGGGGAFNGADNPWSKEGWNLTKQGQLVRTLGEAKAQELAARAGVKLGATHPAAA